MGSLSPHSKRRSLGFRTPFLLLVIALITRLTNALPANRVDNNNPRVCNQGGEDDSVQDAVLFNNAFTVCLCANRGNTLTSDCLTACAAGSYMDEEPDNRLDYEVSALTDECKPCADGSYSAIEGCIGVACCLPCPDMTTSGVGATECTYIPLSVTPTYDLSTPVLCESVRQKAISIALGEYKCICEDQTKTLASSCQDSCPVGQYLDYERLGTGSEATECVNCPKGKFGTSESCVGAECCHACPPGTFQHEDGKGECRNFPAGTWSTITGLDKVPITSYSAIDDEFQGDPCAYQADLDCCVDSSCKPVVTITAENRFDCSTPLISTALFGGTATPTCGICGILGVVGVGKCFFISRFVFKI